jgi:phage terminase large subunit-like protein
MTIGAFLEISKKHRAELGVLLDRDLKYTDKWYDLNDRWVETYGYSLRVQLIFDFIENLIVPSGEGEGQPFHLEDFQKKFVCDIYNPVNSNNERIVRTAILSIARKNGKTAIIAALTLVHLVGPEAIINGEIFSAATTQKQSAIVFKYAAQIVRADPELLSLIKIVDSTKRMVCFSNGSVYCAIAAEAGPAYGINASVVIYDELAQAKNRELYDALETSQGARLEPLFIVISTQSNDPQHILSTLIDDGLSGKDPSIVCHLYWVKDDAENIFSDIELWKQANPALGIFRSLTEMKSMAAKAKRMPTQEAAFRNLYLNQRCDSKSPLIPRQEWEACRADVSIPYGSEIYLALDLSKTTDLSALAAVTAGETDIAKAWFWKPEKTLKEHEKRDRVPYGVWVKQKIIELTPGASIQYDWIAQRLQKIMDDYIVIGLAFDRWGIKYMLSAMERVGVDCYIDGKDEARPGAIRMVEWGQGTKDMDGAITAFETSILNRNFFHDGNPCLTWNISNAMVTSDAAGWRKFDKSKSRFMIDGAQAVAMAMGLKNRDRFEAPATSAYEHEEAECLTF